MIRPDGPTGRAVNTKDAAAVRVVFADVVTSSCASSDAFSRGAGFTFTVLDPGDVIGFVYRYPSSRTEWDVTVQSWVRGDRPELDGPVADAVSRWLATDWPRKRIDRCGR